jgi:hypothetical protein
VGVIGGGDYLWNVSAAERAGYYAAEQAIFPDIWGTFGNCHNASLLGKCIFSKSDHLAVWKENRCLKY